MYGIHEICLSTYIQSTHSYTRHKKKTIHTHPMLKCSVGEENKIINKCEFRKSINSQTWNFLIAFVPVSFKEVDKKKIVVGKAWGFFFFWEIL